MSKPLSAIDCVSPALAQTKNQLFAPFRSQRWLRLAVVCILTGEFAGGGGGGGGNFRYPVSHGKGDKGLMAFSHVDWSKILPWLPWILAGVVLIFLLIFIWSYVSAVFRFVLFDSVLNDRCEFKGSWRRWEPRGRSYFYWHLVLSGISLVALSLTLGVPVLIAWRMGLFHHPGEHLAALILGGVALFFFLIAFVVVGAVIGLFAKDFCIPIMAMEEVGIVDAWRRLLPMLAAEKLAFAFYVLMKIVLAIANAIIVGMATIVLVIVLIIPLGIAGVIIFFVGKAMGLTFSIATICVLAAAGCILLACFLYLLALLNTPSMVFFQSYVLHFIGSRYPAVGTILFPPAPETPPLPPLDLPPTLEPPPEPAPAG
jgi:hypothetical protein